MERLRFSPAKGGALKTTGFGPRSHISGTIEVWLPPQYEQPGYRHTRFPVVELLPGYPGSPGAWFGAMDAGHELSALIRAHRAAPMILVAPKMNVLGTVDPGCADVPHRSLTSTWLGEDVPGLVQQNFRVLGGPKHWATMGYSAGAYCATNLALHHPRRFHAVVSLSGYNAPLAGLVTRDPALARANNPYLELRDARRQPDVVLLMAGSYQDSDTVFAAEVAAQDAAPPGYEPAADHQQGRPQHPGVEGDAAHRDDVDLPADRLNLPSRRLRPARDVRDALVEGRARIRFRLRIDRLCGSDHTPALPPRVRGRQPAPPAVGTPAKGVPVRHRMRLRRRTLSVLAVTATAATMLCAGGQVSAAPATGASASAVTSGDARFEVLSPTLIRTEYAGDASFVDAATFNAIGRDGFASTPFTQSTSDGWLTLTTSAMTLEYKVGSGAFTGQNLDVRLKSGQQDVTASPWSAASATCAPGTLCEAEDLGLSGLSVASDHTGYTGSGFAAGFQGTGSALSFTVTVPTHGQLPVRRAVRQQPRRRRQEHHPHPDPGRGRRSGAATVPADDRGLEHLGAGVRHRAACPRATHTLTLSRTAADSGNVNVDSLALVTPGASYPAPAGTRSGRLRLRRDLRGRDRRTRRRRVGAEQPQRLRGQRLRRRSSSRVRATPCTSPASRPPAPTHSSCATPTRSRRPRTVSVQAGSGTAATATLPGHRSWDDWRTVSVPVTLAAGANDVTIGCPDAASCHVNLDTVAVAAAGAAAAGTARPARRLPPRPGRCQRQRARPPPACSTRTAGPCSTTPRRRSTTPPPRRSPRGRATAARPTRTATSSGTATTTSRG